ncbi:hypothetical protein [Pedobacter heparinus]|uniref:hypothetical protein n=1 Tax=Pedobacter heparinus TaxID=984 RepID=UPI0029314690|nr:hypothetical protein [Pedobacter heparinus]
MELADLRSTWNSVNTTVKTAEEIRLMLKENNHPVLKGIRKQLWIEIMGWSIFLLVYYTMFDGDQKPLLINLALVAAVLFSLLHNLMGYGLAKHLKTEGEVKQTLEHYLLKVKVYAIVSVVSRILLWTGFLLFFTYNIRFTSSKYVLLAVVLIILTVQLSLLGRMWMMRLRKLRDAVKNLQQPRPEK